MISEQEVLQELRAIALARCTDVIQVRDGQLQVADIQDLAAVASIENATGGLRVKFYDKLKALELLGKHLGLFSGQPEAEGGESSLLRLLVDSTGEEVSLDGIPEAEQAAATGDDLVESTGTV